MSSSQPGVAPAGPAAPHDAVACPGCGAVLAPAPGHEGPPGAAAACRRLFEETIRGLRQEAATDPRAAATVTLADTTYAAQHPDPADPGAVHASLDRLVRRFGDEPNPDPAPQRPRLWQMTPADVAAEVDVAGLAPLVETWARSVAEDWSRATRS